MNEQARAEEHLQVIRRLMERATLYRAISAPTALVGGLLSLFASVIYWAWRNSRPDAMGDPGGAPGGFLSLWLLVLFLTMASNAFFICLGANRRGEPIFSASMKAALGALAPALIGGAALTIPFVTMGDDVIKTMSLAAIWAIFYGVGLLATAHFAPPSLVVLGWAFLGTGIVELAAFRFGVPAFLAPVAQSDPATICMAATFGLYHLIYAGCVWPRRGPKAPAER